MVFPKYDLIGVLIKFHSVVVLGCFSVLTGTVSLHVFQGSNRVAPLCVCVCVCVYSTVMALLSNLSVCLIVYMHTYIHNCGGVAILVTVHVSLTLG